MSWFVTAKSNSRSCNHNHKCELGNLYIILFRLHPIVCITIIYCITICGISIGVSAIGIWVCDVAEGGYASCNGGRVSAIPRWIVAVDGVELLSGFLIMLDLGESASSQSHQNQKL